ncbi:hypothetical protein SAMN03159343_4110 [Klenkia marina]|uniref:Uncharacterized protein n=1 Tax=Klenkia marina TaxID=1960309 RepID=A0A1G4Z492_9ACTN|nr:hypothetical protein [Klenkia marina]SCX60514.1 hypothetical protein SAMN03159343_4110 [Klenkia marina]
MSTTTKDVSPAAAGGQQFVSATVHLAGAVEFETAHASWTGIGHVMARMGGVLLYFLDRAAIAGFAIAAGEAGALGAQTFGDQQVRPLPALARVGDGQDASIVLRLHGAQDIGRPHAATTTSSQDGGAFVAVRVGGLTLVLRDQLALAALEQVAATAARAADVLWPDEDADLQLPVQPSRAPRR